MVVGGRELIDTLWNVNEFIDSAVETIQGINRYIMECKFIFLYDSIHRNRELIDTLWIVNFVANLKRPSLLAN